MRRSRRVGAARGERIRVAREPRERRGRRLVDVGVTTTGAGNAAARTAMRADGDADGAIDTDESADSDDDDGSGACSGGARGGVHEHASASACAATSRIHSIVLEGCRDLPDNPDQDGDFAEIPLKALRGSCVRVRA